MWMTTGILMAAAIAGVAAHETTFKGTVAAAEKARVQVRTIDDKGKVSDTPEWFEVTATTKVMRGDKVMPFADAQPKVGERIVVVVTHGDEAGIEWTCPRHSHIAEDKAGKCPVCAMTLKERARPAKAARINFAAQ